MAAGHDADWEAMEEERRWEEQQRQQQEYHEQMHQEHLQGQHDAPPQQAEYEQQPQYEYSRQQALSPSMGNQHGYEYQRPTSAHEDRDPAVWDQVHVATVARLAHLKGRFESIRSGPHLQAVSPQPDARHTQGHWGGAAEDQMAMHQLHELEIPRG
jgi:hypothetical protein